MVDVNYKLTFLLFLLIVLLIGIPMAAARPTYLAAFKENYNTDGTKLDTCNTCHTSGGGSPRNPYGLEYSTGGRDFASIEALDSDNDGITNIDEINALTFPGDSKDFPQTTSEITTNETQQLLNAEVSVGNATSEIASTESINNTTQAQKVSGFEALLAAIGFLSIVGLHRKKG